MLDYQINFELADAHHLDVAQKLLSNSLVLRKEGGNVGVKFFFSPEVISLKKLYMDERDIVFLDIDTLLSAFRVIVYDKIFLDKNFSKQDGEALLSFLNEDVFLAHKSSWMLLLYEDFIKVLKKVEEPEMKSIIEDIAKKFMDEISSNVGTVDAKKFITLCKYCPDVAYSKLGSLRHDLRYDGVLEVLGADDISLKIAHFLIWNGFAVELNSIAAWATRVCPNRVVGKEIEIAVVFSAIVETKDTLHSFCKEDYVKCFRPFIHRGISPLIALKVLEMMIVSFLDDGNRDAVFELFMDLREVLKQFSEEFQMDKRLEFIWCLRDPSKIIDVS